MDEQEKKHWWVRYALIAEAVVAYAVLRIFAPDLSAISDGLAFVAFVFLLLREMSLVSDAEEERRKAMEAAERIRHLEAELDSKDETITAMCETIKHIDKPQRI